MKKYILLLSSLFICSLANAMCVKEMKEEIKKQNQKRKYIISREKYQDTPEALFKANLKKLLKTPGIEIKKIDDNLLDETSDPELIIAFYLKYKK